MQPYTPRSLPSPEPPPIDPQAALHALIRAQGRPELAAERLGLRSADDLLASIVLDENLQDEMRQIMRSFLMVRLLGVANNLEAELLARIDELSAPETAKVYASIINLANELTKGAAATNTNIDIHSTVMKLVPPDVRRALQIVSGDPTGFEDTGGN
jgi:hypothetical protein